jgi:hypothetical protein
MKIFELFNNTLPYKWIDSEENYGSAEFAINNKVYFVSFTLFEADNETPERWDIEFGLRGVGYKEAFKVTNTGDEYPVISTVIAICKDWLGQHPTKCITMSADSPRRKTLYSRMLGRLLPNWRINIHGAAIVAKANK